MTDGDCGWRRWCAFAFVLGDVATGCVGAGVAEGGDASTKETASEEAAFEETSSTETVDPWATSFASVGITRGDGRMSAGARFRDAPDPSGPVTLVHGACRMREAVVAFCDPPCASGALCTGDVACAPASVGVCVGTCVTYATPLSAGTVTLETPAGLSTLVAVEGLDSYYTQEPMPLVDAGAVVTVTASGGTFPAFSAHLVMVPPLVVRDAAAITVTPGEALTIGWTPADPASRVRVILEADLDHGFIPRVRIECDVPDDDGELVVPVAMVNALADPSHWGCGRCPVQRIERYVRTTVRPAGKSVDFELRSEQVFFFKP